jgi:hypothetical protein
MKPADVLTNHELFALGHSLHREAIRPHRTRVDRSYDSSNRVVSDEALGRHL